MQLCSTKNCCKQLVASCELKCCMQQCSSKIVACNIVASCELKGNICMQQSIVYGGLNIYLYKRALLACAALLADTVSARGSLLISYVGYINMHILLKFQPSIT